LINAAVESGAIDQATGLLYRFYAQWSDPRLPEQYQGDSGEDNDVGDAAEVAFDALTADQQLMLRPFVVRPTDLVSYFRTLPATSRRSGNVFAQAVGDPRCEPDGFVRHDVPSAPVTIWGQCKQISPGDPYTYPLEPEALKLVAFMTDLYPRMTADFGTPIGDKFKGASQASNEPDEAGDGRIDVYLVSTSAVAYVRDLSRVGKASTKPTYPKESGTASGYIVIDALSGGQNDLEKKANLAHEFFHVLEYKYNEQGTIECAYPDTSAACAGTVNQKRHWFVEASAAWAEYYYVREATRLPFERWEGFLGQATSMADNVLNRAYYSYMWPLFMEQENHGPSAIAYAWRTMVGKADWQAVQQNVNDAWPFADHLRDFAVRVWNKDLEPGQPINPMFRDLFVDKNFPTTGPIDPVATADHSPRYIDEPLLTLLVPTYNATVDIPELYAQYYDLNWVPGIRQLTFTFSGLTPAASLDVDALVKLPDGTWERRQLDPNARFCLDKPDEAVDQMILVLSNHDMHPQTHITGTWTVTGAEGGCATVSDSLVYTYTHEVNTSDSLASSTLNVLETMTVRVSLKSAEGGNEKFLPLQNDNSGFSVSYTEHSTLTALGCTSVVDAQGQLGGSFSDDPNSPAFITGSSAWQPDGTWTMVIAASVKLTVTSTSSGCGGGGSFDYERVIQLPNCEGTEIRDNDPARIFDFACEILSADTHWTVVGKVNLGF
jgi:hypothetical protein